MKRRGVKEADPFDWEKTPTDNSLGTTTTTTNAVITKPHADSRLAYGGGGVTDNMLDDNVLGSVDNQENLEAPHDRDHDPRRRRRRDTVLHQPQPNINQQQVETKERVLNDNNVNANIIVNTEKENNEVEMSPKKRKGLVFSFYFAARTVESWKIYFYRNIALVFPACHTWKLIGIGE
ncbi:hypothetical protein SK128_012660 [Halocaridina rubra]|uniref:Uncharacterized protein n=1 Tax=Halocaridina rubra TaxID=373956 RepID=A0AAN8WQT2_HALRR